MLYFSPPNLVWENNVRRVACCPLSFFHFSSLHVQVDNIYFLIYYKAWPEMVDYYRTAHAYRNHMYGSSKSIKGEEKMKIEKDERVRQTQLHFHIEGAQVSPSPPFPLSRSLNSRDTTTPPFPLPTSLSSPTKSKCPHSFNHFF